jgi:hypothetical protein
MHVSALWFNHTIRSGSGSHPCSPVKKGHVDQTAEAVFRRFNLHLPAKEVVEVLSNHRRIQLVNLWKPLNGYVLDRPLALAESRSVRTSDLVPIRHIYPDKVGETFSVRYKEQQKWWYWGGMSNTEALVFVCYDSGCNPPED